MMENQAFEALEQKISKILSILERMRKENEQLKQRNNELRSIVEEKEKTIQELKANAERYSTFQNEADAYKESQDHIRARVETLLEKLKEFENIQ